MALSRRSMMLGTAATGVAAATLAACTGGSSGSGSDGGSGSGEVVYANGTEPENPLIPTNTSEVGGGRVITSVFAGLVYYTADAKVENDLAESIESDDNQTWTIKIKPDLKFSDGSALTAQSFVDAWNFGANTANGQKSQSFFEPIEGFDKVSAEDATADLTLSGLEATDDTTITVKLVSAQSDFPNRLGYSAYSPMPESAFDDIEAYGEKPVSNGPYMVDSWTHDQEIVVVPNENYTGARKAKNAGITFTIYDSDETMYNDLESGNVDVVDQIPTSALSTFEDTLGDRAVNEPGAVFQSFTIAQNDPNFSGDAGKIRRKAISRAIDRKTICDKLFYGTRTPATDFIAPVITGGGATDIPGAEVLEFDAAEAKKLWAEAEAIQKFDGEFTLSYNADGPHKDWVEAVCNSIAENLGITAKPQPFPAFGDFREQITNRELKGAFRSGWQADYPSAYNFLGPIYSSAAADGKGSNDGDYKNPEFDQLLAEGLAAADEDAAIEKYKAAEAILMEDLPAIPLWYQNTFGGYSEAVSGVEYGWDTVPLYYEITK
ncbi:peptide ABC transporter substrate-binding protein [Brachybacterium squillarum]|uniref:peptide ABC transporter substrate-binding protein n=1 Tax=Brachybacterium squillarum TaxID=661979 RepID=UPI0022215386|nr:ABC transporter substrate-binding protein [Brachybacterium squillarum]MCW1804969.1 ABC transporter substrate-binding protein [Brachybacterium squillarum]